MSRRLLNLPTTLILIVVMLIASTIVERRSVAAQEDPMGFTVKAEPGPDPATTERGYFVYDLASGKRETGTLRLSNPTEQAIIVELSAVDALTSNNGGSAFATGEAKPTEVGTWITIDKVEVTVMPGEDSLVDFTVRVPKNTSPGQYLAGLVATARPDEIEATATTMDADHAGAAVDVRTRYVIGVQIDVAGEWNASLQIHGVRILEQPSGLIVGINMRNDGDIFLKPKGSVTVTDDQGKVVLNQPIEMGTFVTGTEVTYPVAWPGGPSAGTYTAQVKLEYGDDQTATYNGTLTVSGEAATVAISSFDITEVRDPASNDLQFVNVAIAIDNPAAPVPNARLTLHVTRDGEPVEDFVLASSLTIQSGPGEVGQRYFPPSGWTPGTYSFSITIETVDPTSGEAIVILTTEATTTIAVD